MSPTCDEYGQWLKDQIAGELSPADEARLNAHLAECSGCRLEQQQLESAIGELLSLEDEPVPHHFYVYEQEKTGWRQLLGQLSGWQRTLVAVAALVFVFSIGINIFQVHVSWTDDMLAFSFGAPVRTFDEVEFRDELTEQIRTLVQDEDRRWQQQLRQEFRNSLAALDNTDEQSLERFVAQLEQRLDLKVDNSNAALAERLDSSLMRLYDLVAEQRADDLNQINDRLQQLASSDRLQTDHVEAVMASVVELAEVASR